MDYRRWPWQRILGEAALIFASVYLAIVLEGISSDRARATEARSAIVQLRSELGADQNDLAEILEVQVDQAGLYTRLGEWLASPDNMPGADVDRALERLAESNRTMFPRQGAWTSIVSTGLLAWVGNAELVTRIGNFYENINERLEYNGRDYDYNLNEVMRTTASAAWDRRTHQPRGDLTQLRNELRYIEVGWNAFYLDLLRDYERELNGLVEDIDAYLARVQ